MKRFAVITGTRDNSPVSKDQRIHDLVHAALISMPGETIVIHGGCATGVDATAHKLWSIS